MRSLDLRDRTIVVVSMGGRRGRAPLEAGVEGDRMAFLETVTRKFFRGEGGRL
jgi:hypothetical protein